MHTLKDTQIIWYVVIFILKFSSDSLIFTSMGNFKGSYTYILKISSSLTIFSTGREFLSWTRDIWGNHSQPNRPYTPTSIVPHWKRSWWKISNQVHWLNAIHGFMGIFYLTIVNIWITALFINYKLWKFILWGIPK